MDLRQKFTANNYKETEDFYTISFDSNLISNLEELGESKSSEIVRQIEYYVNEYHKILPPITYELCGVVKGENPFYYIIGIDNTEHMIFEFLFEVDSDTYLDWYNENLEIS